MVLRDKQRARRAREIVDAAADLFRKKGYTSTTIEDVAELAMVAPATVYNYFGSKDGLLQEIVREHIATRQRERDRFLADLPDSPDEAIKEFLGLFLDSAFDLIDRRLWRQVLASGITRGDRNSSLLAVVTDTLVIQFERLFEIFQSRGLIDSNVSCRDLAEAAMGIADFHFYRYVCDNEFDLTDCKHRIETQINLLLNGVFAS